VASNPVDSASGIHDLTLFRGFDWKSVFSSSISVPSFENRDNFLSWLGEMTEPRSSLFDSVLFDYSTVISRQPLKENIELSLLIHPACHSPEPSSLLSSENIFWSYPLLQRLFYNKDDSIVNITFDQVFFLLL
jgi:hypothetical protein